MKRALSITLAGTLFTIEEDAYEKLSSYLTSVQTYFGTYPDSAEIVKDIEARMAEQLLAMHENTSPIITIENVEKLISVMGRVEDFDAEGEKKEEIPKAPRKLMRDPDDTIIAGVTSGVAHYFAADVTMMRIIFILITLLMGGAGGIIIYIVLALLIPAAKTPAEKLMMRGGPVSLESFKKNVHDVAASISTNSKEFFNDSRPRNFIERLFRALGKTIKFLARIVVKLVGILLIILSSIAVAFLVFGFIMVMFNAAALSDISLVYQVLPHATYYLLVVFAFIAALIPLVILYIAGKYILKLHKPKMRPEAIIGLLALWVISLAIVASISVRYAPQIRNAIESSPQYQTTTQVVPVSEFSKIDMHGHIRVQLIQASTTQVSVEGRVKDIERTTFSVANDTLSYDQKDDHDFCIFCKNQGKLVVTISTPDIESIVASDISTIEGNIFTLDTVTITTSDIAKVSLPITAQRVQIEQRDASQVFLTGSSTQLHVTTSDIARFDGFSLQTVHATITSRDASHAEVSASSTLTADASDVARIEYRGNPSVTENTEDNGKINRE